MGKVNSYFGNIWNLIDVALLSMTILTFILKNFESTFVVRAKDPCRVGNNYIGTESASPDA